MSSKDTYVSLDTIKLALDSSCLLLDMEGNRLTDANVKSINHTIQVAHMKLREYIDDMTVGKESGNE
jgi:hypothetical protein